MKKIIYTHFGCEIKDLDLFRTKQIHEQILADQLNELIKNRTPIKSEPYIGKLRELINSTNKFEHEYRCNLIIEAFYQWKLEDLDLDKNILKSNTESSGDIRPETLKSILNAVIGIRKAQSKIDALYDKCKRFVERYRKGSENGFISLVYVFISVGYEGVLTGVKPFRQMELERYMRNLMEQAIFSCNAERLVQIIGVEELTSLLSFFDDHLDENLTKYLTTNNNFYYDAPKFVEAIIRMARPDDHIFRFDDDVEFTRFGIKTIEAEIAKNPRKIIFFSGSYNAHCPENEKEQHFVNDYAIRTSFIIRDLDKDNRCVWHYDENKGEFEVKKGKEAEKYYLDPVEMEKFLKSILIGLHKQLKPAGRSHAPQADTFLRVVSDKSKLKDEILGIKNERKESVSFISDCLPISGAGLYISPAAIRSLPPLTNAEKITFIDDAIKYLMHYYIEKDALLGRADTNFKQTRIELMQGEKISDKIKNAGDIKWALNNYLPVLIKGILSYNLVDFYFGDIIVMGALAAREFDSRRSEMSEFLMQIYDLQIEWWNEVFKDKSPEWPLLYFISKKASCPGFRTSLVKQVVDTFRRYLDMKLDFWPRVVELFQDKQATDMNPWLKHPGYMVTGVGEET